MAIRRRSSTLAVLAAVGAIIVVHPSFAQIAVGGGTTLPENLYDEILPSVVGKTLFSYTGTGSSIGKSAFLNNNATVFVNETVASKPAWNAAQSVHFAGSDSILSNADYLGYVGTRQPTWGPLIQIPAVGTAVLVPYVKSGVTALDITGNRLCQVYSNPNYTWNQLQGGSAGGGAINVVYRLDGSGTTELLSNYLVAACPGAGFVKSNNFRTVVAGALGLSSTDPLPGHWVGRTGSSEVGDAFKEGTASEGRLGYLSPDPRYTGSDNSVVAKINGKLPTAASVRAALSAFASTLPAVTVGSPSGAASDPRSWVPDYVTPAGYPIVGTTNLLVNQCYRNSTIQNRILTWLYALTGGAFNDAIETGIITPSHQFAVLPENWSNAIKNNFLTDLGGNGLSIGNPNVCSGTIGRPLVN